MLVRAKHGLSPSSRHVSRSHVIVHNKCCIKKTTQAASGCAFFSQPKSDPVKPLVSSLDDVAYFEVAGGLALVLLMRLLLAGHPSAIHMDGEPTEVVPAL